MNIALIGFGKMGQEIANLCEDHHIWITIDPHHPDATFKSIREADFNGTDVAIDFTRPNVCVDNIKALAEKGINTVVGTTGWYDQLDEVQKIVTDAGIGFLWASNFAIGVHLFWKMVENGAQLMNQFDEYDTAIHEAHHKFKADSPSGTARTTSDILLKHLDRKDTVTTESLDRKIKPNELHVTSSRIGNIPGTHTVTFDSTADTIEIIHTSRNRSGFAAGALRCAEWLEDKKGFFSIEDYLNDLNIK